MDASRLSNLMRLDFQPKSTVNDGICGRNAPSAFPCPATYNGANPGESLLGSTSTLKLVFRLISTEGTTNAGRNVGPLASLSQGAAGLLSSGQVSKILTWMSVLS